MNIFGQFQDKEKFCPLVIDKVMKGETVYIHGYPDKKKLELDFIYTLETFVMQSYL